MSASQASALSAIALQLLGALDGYEADMAVLLASGSDGQAVQLVRQRMDQLRAVASALPAVSIAWTELLIRHFELAHTAWMQRNGTTSPAEFLRVRELHDTACARLRTECRRALADPDVPARF